MKIQRDDIWLLSRLDYLWSRYFINTPQNNKVFIKFGRFAKFRLGSIKLDKKSKSSFITITGMFKNPKIPMAVIDCTIAHELTHYSHGFSSPHPKMHKYPHEGGVVKREMQSRGMGHLLKAYRDWIKEYRKEFR
ncbi:hypothetical protein A3B42_05065 [Candidatus Daviesbacteria bacterium RIFCSPLOWO2_01_FULL_38_10]|nr:MAG: hypothetical protein A3D02_03775 [Candidatus Daviesbacteria bacterium RIFCSPHIGHO2_02_FULL_39_41]OGE38964.1 MAG: hypothetical protein A3B42_05065 [Candidatus Daviesbacteria bacterium RIFCSPLOWO2_01_FULL_38_10]OGE45050.1 MAG: hypothetical protein A3E67_00855 [Candidatus Daviesbacteria bacterium RIFCSPHIGHO2_12_FULL_38_25]OGE67534.1 MAG: hypothetical protein A3H81_00800 [Candidatus Daviesbacteria bacterium RIFCSPLOWO2_02_FULL_38_18]OGE72754.1 MAG: hypothetical protein A3H18_03770 [Candida